MLKLGKKIDGDGKNMNKYDYNDIITKIKILELKLKRNSMEKEHCTTLYNLLREEEEVIFAHLYTIYDEFTQMISLKKKQ